MAMCIYDAHVLEVEQPVSIDGQVDVVAPRAAQVRGERRQMIDAFRVAEHQDRHPLTEAHAARHPKRSRQPGAARRGQRGCSTLWRSDRAGTGDRSRRGLADGGRYAASTCEEEAAHGEDREGEAQEGEPGRSRSPTGGAQVGVPLRRGQRHDARPPRRQGCGSGGDDARRSACAARLHHHHRGVQRLLRQRTEVSPRHGRADGCRAAPRREANRQAIWRPEESAAGQRPQRREVLDAGNDGHGAEPRPERIDARRLGCADEGSPLRPRRPAALHPAVQQDRAWCRRTAVRGRSRRDQAQDGRGNRRRSHPRRTAEADRPVSRDRAQGREDRLP